MKKRKINGWGLYPKIEAEVFSLSDEIKALEILKQVDEIIPYGNGRSYGDSSLNNKVLDCRSYNYFIEFDELNGILKAQAGVLLSEILNIVVPKGWFLSITPGTKLITLGGAIASDVHGKNHHKDGCFSECVDEIKIMKPDGEIVFARKGDELFKATCGGMGLTGIILEASIRLKKINSIYIDQIVVKTKNLDETFEAFEQYAHYPYSVAWIDCLARKSSIGRCVLMAGDFRNDGRLNYKEKRKLNVPFNFPSLTLNKFSVKAFNFMYYNKILKKETRTIADIDSFFYPLDAIDNWNRIYGKNGFTQYQFILPKETSREGLKELLEEISKSGKGSFLAVLKLYGKANENYLSFPMEGYSLALDFKIEKGLFEFLDKLDRIVLNYGGRIYLTKDARIGKEVFEKGYPNIDKFREFREKIDPKRKLNSLQSKRLEL